MNAILALVAKDFRIFFKDGTAVALSFFVPMLLILIFGLIFGGDGSPSASGIRLVVVNESESTIADTLIDALEAEPTFSVITERTLDDGTAAAIDRDFARSLLVENASTYRYALILPANLVADTFGLNFELLYNPQSEIENGIAQGVLQKILFAKALPAMLTPEFLGIDPTTIDDFNADIAAVVSEEFDIPLEDVLASFQPGQIFPFGAATTPPANSDDAPESAAAPADAATDFLAGLFSIESEQIYGKGKNPAAQSVAGWALMFLLFSLSSAASSLFEERNNGIFHRILAAPVTRSHILASKFIFSASLGLMQMLVLMVFGDLLFDVITSTHQLLPLLLISTATSAAATAFGMLLAAFSKSQAQASGLATLLILSMSALGGAMFPIFMIPDAIRTFVSPLTPIYWAMDGILAVLWRDASIAQIALPTTVLFGIAAVTMAISLLRFRSSNLLK